MKAFLRFVTEEVIVVASTTVILASRRLGLVLSLEMSKRLG